MGMEAPTTNNAAVPTLSPVTWTDPDPVRAATDATVELLLEMVTSSVTSTVRRGEELPNENTAVAEHGVR